METNNNINFDPMTGQPIGQSAGTQPAYSQQPGTQNYTQPPYLQNYAQQPGQSPMPPYVLQEQINDNKRMSKIFSILSLCVWLSFHISFFFRDTLEKYLGAFFSTFIQPYTGLLIFGAYALTILALVKDRNNNFAKVLTILYVIEFILGIFLVVIGIALFGYLFWVTKGFFNPGR